MSYSIRNYVKKHCTEKYTLDDMETLATNVSNDSDGRYTDKSALKILCRYAHVQNGNICFNVNSRNSDQTLENLKKYLDDKSACITNNNTNNNDNTNNINNNINNKNNVNTSNNTNTNNNVNSIVNVETDTNDNNNANTQKRKGFGNLSTTKHSACIDSEGDDKPILVKKTKKPVGKSDIKLVTRANTHTLTMQNNVNELVPKKRANVFTSTATSTTTSLTTTTSNTATTSVSAPKKKGGFGVFTKALVNGKDNNNDSDTNKPKIKQQGSTKSLRQNKDDNFGYKFPQEGKYKGLVRTDKKYGPYGTDNYYDEKIQDDQIDKDAQQRVLVFKKLNSRPYPLQRSIEWFALRSGMITASDGGTIVRVNPYEHDFGFIVNKVFGKPFITEFACYHGKKYEQVATSVYEYRMNVKVKEFGLCQHPKYKFLGASPDGIVSEYKLKTKDGRSWEELEAEANLITDPKGRDEFLEAHCIKTKFVGRMLEIKCPFSRDIILAEDTIEVYGVHGEIIKDLYHDCKKGICPTYYWVQIQLQLQCCELDECDFWQCKVFEYADKEDFLDDTNPDYPWLSRQTGHEKGAVIQLMPCAQVDDPCMPYINRIYNHATFIYQPRVDMTPAEIDIWILNALQNLKTTHKEMVFDSVKYWKLVATRNITIKRDDKWFKDNLDTFRNAWDCVEYLRANKDKASLLKRYINTFPVDRFKKIKEPRGEEGIIMKNLQKLVNEPAKNAPKKDHTAYTKFIAKLEKDIKKSGVDDPKDYNVVDDITHINATLNNTNEFHCDKNNPKTKIKELTELVKFIAAHVDKFHSKIIVNDNVNDNNED